MTEIIQRYKLDHDLLKYRSQDIIRQTKQKVKAMSNKHQYIILILFNHYIV